MAEVEKKVSAGMNKAAEAAGRALGEVANAIESLQAQHPHPVEEVREALSAGQEKVTALASDAGTRVAAVVKKTKSAVVKSKVAAKARRGASTTKKALSRARRGGAKAAAGVRRTAGKVVKRAKKAIKRGRKTARRAASRLKR